MTTPADHPALKPCAHCGGPATERINGHGGVYSVVTIGCKPCNYHIGRCGRVGMTIEALRAEVAAIWNRRAAGEIAVTDKLVHDLQNAMQSSWDLSEVKPRVAAALAAALNPNANGTK
jgi:hypothetical protein